MVAWQQTTAKVSEKDRQCPCSHGPYILMINAARAFTNNVYTLHTPAILCNTVGKLMADKLVFSGYK